MNPDILVRFYVLKTAESQATYRLVYKLCKKACEEQQKVGIICANEEMLEILDKLLWSEESGAFIPHVRLGDPLEKKAAIVLYCLPERISSTDVLINLGYDEKLDIPQQCQKVFEIVNQQPIVLKATRNRYRLYQQLSLTPETVTINLTHSQ